MSTGAGDRLRADPGQLLATAEQLRGTARVLAGGPLLRDAAAAAGDPGLASAVEQFDQAWGRVWSELDDDLVRLADALTLLSATYQQVERACATGFGRLLRRVLA